MFEYTLSDRHEMRFRGYAELHARTNFTFLTGASHPEDLVATAGELGICALAITDVNSLAGVVQAHAYAKKIGQKIIIGSEIQLSPCAADPHPPSAVVLATSRHGYAQLSQLITQGRRRAEKGECRLHVDDLLAANRGEWFVIVLPPDSFRVRRAWGRVITAEVLASWRAVFGDRLFLGLRRWFGAADRARTQALAALAMGEHVPALAINSVEMHVPNQQPLHDVMACVRDGVAIDAAGYRLLPNAEAVLKSPEQMAKLFWDMPEAIARTVEVADACNFSLDELRFEYPAEAVPAGHSPTSFLRELTEAGAAQRYPNGVPALVRILIEKELALIAELGYEPYFLTICDVVAFAREREILHQGRGSAANSAVCFCLGITPVDPAVSPMLFERFISRERNEPPDIDVDFEHERREEVLQYIYEKYGRERAAMVCEVIRYRERSALREVGKVMGLSLDQVDRLAKLSRAVAQPDGRADLRQIGLDPADRRVTFTVALANEIRDFPRHLSIHTGGFIIARDALGDLVPIENAAMDGRTVIQWDKYSVEAMGMLKVDCLALGMLTAIRKCFDLVSGWDGTEWTLSNVPREDPATYEMIRAADTVGVFQIESRAQMSMLPRLKPAKFYDLVIQVAIVRPGPIQGDMVHPYLRRRDGKEPVRYPIPELEPVLARTLGVPLFQEQCMELAVVAAGFTPGEADKLRKAVSGWKRGELTEMQTKLMAGMAARGISQKFAEQIFQQIAGFAEYGFPESHAASFAWLAYVSSYLKCHHAAAFICAIINSQPMGFYSPSALVQDAERHGVTVLPIDVTRSEIDCILTAPPPRPRIGNSAPMPESSGSPAIRLGLRLLKGLSTQTAEAIVDARRERPFSSVADVARRAKIGKSVMQKLADAGAFRQLQPPRRAAVWEASWEQTAADEPLFANLDPSDKPPTLRPYSDAEIVRADYRHTGLSLYRHPMSLVRHLPPIADARTVAEFRETAAKETIRLAGLVQCRQRPATAKGTTFITLEDETGAANLIVWHSVGEHWRREIFGSRFLLATGTVQREGIVVHLVVEKLEAIDYLFSRLPTRSRDFY